MEKKEKRKRTFEICIISLKMNGIQHLLVYTDDVNLLGDDVNTIKKNTESLTDASKEVGLEVNTEKTASICRCLITRVQGNKIL
jgi:hypothetical protein